MEGHCIYIKPDRSFSCRCFTTEDNVDQLRERYRERGREKRREMLAHVLAANGLWWLCVCVWVGGRTCTCTAERWGLGPGLMRCFRDNARRGVDMWFGRRLYAIFYSLFLITYFSVFFTLPFVSPPLPPHRSHSFCRLLISLVWRLTVTNRGTPQQYLHTTGGTNYYRLFSSTFQKPWLFMRDCGIYDGLHSEMFYVSLWRTRC